MGLIKSARAKQGKRPAVAPLPAPAPSVRAEVSDDEDDDSSDEERQKLDQLLESARLAARASSSAARLDRTDEFDANAELVRFSDDDDELEPAQPARKKRKVDPLVRPVSLADLRPKEPVASTSRAPAVGATDASKWGTLPTRKLSKKERQKSSKHTAGAKWFDMPAQEPTPELRREVQAMRLHGVLDPKRFLRGEAKRDRQKLPEFFQIGHVLPQQRSASTASVGASVRKKSFVDELVADAQARTRARKQYADVQAKSASGGKQWFAALKARRHGGRPSSSSKRK